MTRNKDGGHRATGAPYVRDTSALGIQRTKLLRIRDQIDRKWAEVGDGSPEVPELKKLRSEVSQMIAGIDAQRKEQAYSNAGRAANVADLAATRGDAARRGEALALLHEALAAATK